MIKIGICGIGGRMGRALTKAALQSDKVQLTAGSVRAGDALAGKPVPHPGGGELHLIATDDAAHLMAHCDVAIDFTNPEATRHHVTCAAETGTAIVIGTTGLSADDQAVIDKASRQTPILQAANFSLGVNLLSSLVSQTARALGPDFDIEILEMHHRHKIDAPSGTALALGKAAAQARGIDLDKMADRVRDGITGPRKSGHIGFATLRGGDVAGEHCVIFAGAGERIELTHKATDRVIFARGAVEAGVWLSRQSPGSYAMRDVLGLANDKD